MKKHFLVPLTIVIAIILLNAFSNDSNATTPPEENIETPTISTAPEDEISFSDKNNSFTVDSLPSEEDLQQPEGPVYTESEKFLLSAADELGIGFNNYGTIFELHDNYMIINYPDSTKGITKMYASNDFLNAHTIEFIAPEDSNICTFVPKTLDSLGYVEDDPDTWESIGECYGYVWESSLKNHLGIQWEYGAPIEIVIDDEYRIFINKEFENAE